MEIPLEQLHHIELTMLRFFHAFCEKNQLRYYLSGGALLGAVRQKGFIPWDDDIDVNMPRKDYIKLLSLQATLPPSLRIMSFNNPPGYYYTFAKLVDTRTIAYEPHHNLPLGVFIDIFPIDGVPEDKTKQNKIEKDLTTFERQVKYHYFMAQGYRPKPNALVYYFKKLYYGKPKGGVSQAYKEMIDELLEYDFDSSKEVKNYRATQQGQVPKEFYGKPTPVLFEGSEFFGVEKADAYLKHYFGDYMTPLPVAKRKRHNVDIKYQPHWTCGKIVEELKEAKENI